MFKSKILPQTIYLRKRTKLKHSSLRRIKKSSDHNIWINNFVILQELASGSTNRVLLVKHVNHKLYVIRTPLKKSSESKNPLTRKTNLFSTSDKQVL